MIIRTHLEKVQERIQYDSHAGMEDKGHGKFEQPLFWNKLEGVDLHMNMNNVKESTETMETVLGIDKKTYDKIIEFQNLCATYGVRKEQGEAAYEIADK